MTKPRWIAHNQNCIPKRLKPSSIVQAALSDGTYRVHWFANALYWNKTVLKPLVPYVISYQIVGKQ